MPAERTAKAKSKLRFLGLGKKKAKKQRRAPPNAGRRNEGSVDQHNASTVKRANALRRARRGGADATSLRQARRGAPTALVGWEDAPAPTTDDVGNAVTENQPAPSNYIDDGQAARSNYIDDGQAARSNYIDDDQAARSNYLDDDQAARSGYIDDGQAAGSNYLDDGQAAGSNYLGTTNRYIVDSSSSASEEIAIDSREIAARRDDKLRWLLRREKYAWLSMWRGQERAEMYLYGEATTAKPDQSKPYTDDTDGPLVIDDSSSYSDSSYEKTPDTQTFKAQLMLPHAIDDLHTSRMDEHEFQKVVPSNRKDPELALLQSNLREHSRETVDIPELRGNQEKEYTRDRKTAGERRSAGWATMAMREGHRAMDRGDDPEVRDWRVRYYFEEADDLATRMAARMGGERLADRSKMIVTWDRAQQKWVDADSKLYDTSDAAVLTQTLKNKKSEIRAKLDRLGGQQRAMGETELQRLEARINRLQAKLADLAADPKLAGHHIFVMNAAGEIFAGKGEEGIVHHSSFLAGGAIAAGGEIGIQGGTVTYLSNMSGHYYPGPAYLWQVVKQMEMMGVPLDFTVKVTRVEKTFKARAFLAALNPHEDASWFDGPQAIIRLNAMSREERKGPPDFAAEGDDRNPRQSG